MENLFSFRKKGYEGEEVKEGEGVKELPYSKPFEKISTYKKDRLPYFAK